MTLSSSAAAPNICDLPDASVPLDDMLGCDTVNVQRGRALNSESDMERLVRRAQQGDASAFEQLAVTFLRPAYSVALAVVRRPSDAEDVAQDALLAAFERIDSCREPGRFVAWLMTIVRNQSKNWLARRRLRDVLPHDDAIEVLAPEVDIDGGLVRDRLVRAMGVLNVAEREVVLLHDLEGFTHQEISDALGISCVMSRQHLFVARRKLRATLGDATLEGGDHEP
ncbi:MAG TPA: RNA polymerase sigma factor [Polyangiaceae bacterium]|nr:RNA polymerase sigma factor [Polyangiaceae bacterium]